MKNSIGPVDIEFALRNINFEEETARMKQQIAGISTTAKREATETGNILKNALGGLGNLGIDIPSMVGAGGAVAAAFKFKQLADESFEFEKAYGMAMREVQTISKAVQADFEGISQSIIDMSANSPDDAIKLAKAYYQIVSAGHDGAAGLELLSVASKAAVAGVTDTMTAADGLTTVINAWGLSADQANTVADTMFKTVERGKTTFSQLASNIAQVAPLASANGIGLNEIFAALQTITKQGTPTAQAMTQIRSSIINMNNALGDGWSKTMTYQEGLNMISEKAGGSQTELKKLIPDVEGMSAVLAMTGEKAKGAAEDLNETTKATGAMETAYGRMMEEANNKWSVIHNKWTREIRGIGSAMKNESTNIANFMDALLSNGSDVDSKFNVMGVVDRMKAMNTINGGSWGNKLMSYLISPFVPDAAVQQGYDKYVKNIVDYAKKGLSEQQIKLSDILGISDKDERIAKLNGFLVSMKAAEDDLGNTVLRNSDEQNKALEIRAKLWGEVEAKAKEAIKSIEETTNSGGGDAQARTLKTMLDELKTVKDSFGSGSFDDDLKNLAKQAAIEQEIKAYYDKIREARKIEPIEKIKPLSANDTLVGIQAITKEQSKQESQGDKLLKQSKAKTTEAQKQADAIKEQNDLYARQMAFYEGLSNKLGDAAELLGAMSYAVGEFDSTLGESVGKMADIANNAANLAINLAPGGDPVSAIASGIGILGNIIGLLGSNNEDPTVLKLNAINKTLEQQSAILASLADTNYFELASKQIADYSEAINLNNESLRDSYIITKEEQAKLLALPTKPQEYTGNDPFEKAQYKKQLEEFNKARTQINKVNAEIAAGMNERKNWTPAQFIEAYAKGSLILDQQQIEWVKGITDAQRERADLIQQTYRELLGFDASEVSDSIMQGIEDGKKLTENGLGGFAESFGEQIKKALTKGITEAMNIKLTEGFMTDFNEFMLDGLLNTDERKILEEEYINVVKDTAAKNDAIQSILDSYGVGNSSISANSALRGISASLTEDTGSALVGQLMAVRTDVKEILKQVAMGQDDVSRNLLYLKEIAYNTSFNKELIPISGKLDSIEKVLKDRL